jgi:hypothetical protein
MLIQTGRDTDGVVDLVAEDLRNIALVCHDNRSYLIR